MLGRPSSYSQLSNLLRTYPRVKANGVGHSWWKDQFCAGHNGSAIGVITTEFDFLRDA